MANEAPVSHVSSYGMVNCWRRNKLWNSGPCEPHMKSQGEIEAAICAGISRFEQDYMGRGPKDIHAYLIGDLLVVRLKGVLTVAEQQLVAVASCRKGEGPAQASENPFSRNRAADHGGDDSGGHRRGSREPASRHQHGDGRRGGDIHAGRVAALSWNKEIGLGTFHTHSTKRVIRLSDSLTTS